MLRKITHTLALPNHLKSNQDILKYVLYLFLGWRLVLFFITFLGLSSLPNTDFYHHLIFFPNSNLDYWSRWANWDGQAYQQIANLGYQPVQTVFFPAYSVLIKILTLFGLPSYLAGFLISQLGTLIALFFLFKLVLLDLGEKIARRSALALLIFPTGFYLVSLYNESLLLSSTLAAIYFARTKKWRWAALAAAVAATTRLVGVAVIISIMVEYLITKPIDIKLSQLWKKFSARIFFYSVISWISLNIILQVLLVTHNLTLIGVISSVIGIFDWLLIISGVIALFDIIRHQVEKVDFKKLSSLNFLYLALSVVPLLLYFLFLQINFHSPFSFLNYESVWGKYLSAPWQGPINSLQFLAVNMFTLGEYSARVHVRLLIFLVTLICLFFSFKKLRFSYSIYFLIAMLIPLFSGTLIDFPRYSLAFFPVFILLGLIENDLTQKIGAMLSFSLLTFLVILFFNSYFFM